MASNSRPRKNYNLSHQAHYLWKVTIFNDEAELMKILSTIIKNVT